ncbi:unnamed protein product [Adineta steineri]|uniref:Uncharacterized protein n=2 Tax=Adineta steineri TaxID=433720 RepID=A0A820AZY1_9BILA|nr:unnamed protein product [Adineta steineri]CAF4129843.1 unnamed protein product [Adineta steineri]CAF4193278.1 unnamed protein product [Adineta steineri]
MDVNVDLLDEFMVKEKLKNGDYLMVINTKDRTSTWSELRLIADAKDPDKPFVGWAICRYCCAAFRTHSKLDNKGKRKNHGLTSCTKHLEQCSIRKKEMAAIAKENSSFHPITPNSQPSVSQFLVNKKKIAPCWSKKLKEAEAKFVVGGMHSFKSVEHSGLLNLAQTCVDLGARFGKIDIHDIWYGRKSIKDECYNRFILYKNEMVKEMKKYAMNRTLSATTDLWRDDAIGRYYLDFTVFWIDHAWKLHHALLRCKHFQEQSKTAINLWDEIESIFNEFYLILGDTPITTDEGANIKASLKDEIRLPCMAHRSSTTLETAWEATRTVCAEFNHLINCVLDLRSFIARSGNIQPSLPMTIKKIVLHDLGDRIISYITAIYFGALI